jgi:hypothetical protein
MKNYKHSIKSNKAMKIALVTAAAIILAPVTFNSVTTLTNNVNVVAAATSTGFERPTND